MRLSIKTLNSKAKKCDSEEMAARQRVKKSFRSGNIEAARIYAEKAIRHRNQSRYYQGFSARLSPMIGLLKNELSHSVNGRSSSTEALHNLSELHEILQNIDDINKNIEKETDSELRSASSSEIPIPTKEVENVMQQLTDEMGVELSNRLPSIDGLGSTNIDVI